MNYCGRDGCLNWVNSTLNESFVLPNLMVNQVVHTNNPADSTKSLTDTYANDPFEMRRPASIATITPASAVRWSTGGYAYDGTGNVKTIGTHTFTYDKVSRLTASNQYLEPTTSTTLRTQSFTYDAFGNLLAFGGSSARNTPTAPQTNHLTGATYDPSGNVVTWNGNQYSYDPFHLMWDYKTLTDEWAYLYTADDERAWSYKTDNTSLWTLRGLDGKVLREYTTNGTWSVAEDYIYRGGLLLAAETPAGTRHFHLDHLGTPRLVSNNLGQQAAYHVYYPYGEEATAFNQDTIREKFTGHERDLGNLGGAGDDLDYMHARHESEWMGRFLGVDPARGKSKAPQSWNRYEYVQGNPLKFIDPNGRDTTTTTSGASFGDPVDDWDLVWNSTGAGVGFTEILLGALISSEDPEHGSAVEEMGEANVEKALTSLEGELADAAAPVGRRGVPMEIASVQPVRNQAALIDGHTFTGHALDQMQNRGIPLSAVNNALQHGTAEAGNIKGTTAFLDTTNKIKVIVDTQSGRVVTVLYYKPPKK